MEMLDEIAIQNIIKHATDSLTITVIPREKINVPEFYFHPEEHKIMANSIFDNILAAHRCALAYRITNEQIFLDKTVDVIYKWVKINTGSEVSLFNESSRLDLVVYFSKFIVSGWLLKDYKNIDNFDNWVQNIYIQECHKISNRNNNWGAWALYGEYISKLYLGENTDSMFCKLLKYLNKATLNIPFVGKKDEFYMENLRNNSGMWYTYMVLAPLTRMLHFMILEEKVSTDVTNKLLSPFILKHLYYCNNPEKWPYKKSKIFPLKQIQHFLWPSEDKLQLPEGWPYNMIEGISIKNMCSLIPSDVYIKNMRPIQWGPCWTYPTAYKIMNENGIKI